jgi:hypothetical protein
MRKTSSPEHQPQMGRLMPGLHDANLGASSFRCFQSTALRQVRDANVTHHEASRRSSESYVDASSPEPELTHEFF